MSTKNCKSCDKNLSLEYFSGRSLSCKKCKSEQAKAKYNDKRKCLKQTSDLDDSVSIKKIMKIHTEEFVEMLNNDVSYTELSNKFAKVSNYFKKLKHAKKMLLIKIKIPNAVREYWNICGVVGIDNGSKRDHLFRYERERPKDAKFKKAFGKYPDELYNEIIDDVENLETVVKFISSIYTYIYRSYVSAQSLEVVNTNGFYIACFYDPESGCIHLENPLGYNRVELYEQIQETMKSEDILISGYRDNGLHDLFFSLVE